MRSARRQSALSWSAENGEDSGHRKGVAENPLGGGAWIDLRPATQFDVEKVQAFYKKGKGRTIWSNVQVNMLFSNGIIGHLRGSYDGDFGRGSFGLETLEVVGSDGRFILREACEMLEFYPRFSHQVEKYAHLGGMMSFNETFDSRIGRWVEQNLEGVAPDEIEGSGEEGLAAQEIIEGAIRSFQTGSVIEVADG